MGSSVIKKYILLTGMAAVISSCGINFLSFGENEETENPGFEQVGKCRTVMHISPELSLVPLGYKLQGDGIDDIIWFKFITHNKNFLEYFDLKTVDASGFSADFIFPRDDIKWWDVDGKKLFGGSIELPGARFMTVGIEQKEDFNIVYIIWNET